MKPALRCYYWGETRALVNLGDLLTPHLLDALGYACAPRQTADSEVANPGRCLLVIGSLLTQPDLDKIAYPVDVWGTGWKGTALAPATQANMRFFAVRGPQTAAGLRLAEPVAMGDAALLFPHLLPHTFPRHEKTLLIPHFSRLTHQTAAQCRSQTGCAGLLSPLVLREPWSHRAGGPSLQLRARLLLRRLRFGFETAHFWDAIAQIAGASFVLTGSLHGAILAQAYGVPWAAYDDGFVDAPAKWGDWAAYLGVDLAFVQTLAQGQQWWQRHGRQGRLRDLTALLHAFPYPRLAGTA